MGASGSCQQQQQNPNPNIASTKPHHQFLDSYDISQKRTWEMPPCKSLEQAFILCLLRNSNEPLNCQPTAHEYQQCVQGIALTRIRRKNFHLGDDTD